MRPHNYLEEIVPRLADRLIARDTDFCRCSQCRDDLVAMVLGEIKPAYASTKTGHAIRSVAMEQSDVQTEVMVHATKCMEAISRRPHH